MVYSHLRQKLPIFWRFCTIFGSFCSGWVLIRTIFRSVCTTLSVRTARSLGLGPRRSTRTRDALPCRGRGVGSPTGRPPNHHMSADLRRTWPNLACGPRSDLTDLAPHRPGRAAPHRRLAAVWLGSSARRHKQDHQSPLRRSTHTSRPRAPQISARENDRGGRSVTRPIGAATDWPRRSPEDQVTSAGHLTADQLRQVTGPRQTLSTVSCSPLRAPRQPAGRVVTRLQPGRRTARPPDRLLTATSNPAGRRCNKTTSSEPAGADTVAIIYWTNTVHTVTHKGLTSKVHTHTHTHTGH